MDFVHLHTHSHYSLLDGLAKIDELIDKAKKEKMKALALTDHGVMYGAVEFYQKAKAAGLKPIIGVETYLARYGRHNKRPKIDERPYHLILLAKNEIGYKNLIKLTTSAYLEGFYYKPRIDWEILEKYHQGLIALSACLKGEVPDLIRTGQIEKAEETALKYKDLFGPDFYLELQYHPHLPEQELINKVLIKLSKKLEISLVATNDIHYLNSEDAEAHDVLLCLQTKKKLGDKDRKLCMLGEDFSFRGLEKMIEDFKDYPEAIDNTNKIAERCNLDLELGKLVLPYFDLPNSQTPDQALRELCYQGIAKRYKKENKEIIDRLEFELSVIKKTDFSSYFLIAQDFVNWAKSHNIVVGPGRGSAAGSLVSYLINITNIDPLKYGLLFERFLNPERIAPPDIDLDFADTRRNEVIEYVEEKYGRNHVAQIITFGTMAARAAIRDVGRVQGLPYNYCDKVAKLIPLSFTLDEALRTVFELKELYNNEPEAKKLIDTARRLEGVARHASTHACGVVITKEPLDEYLPVQYASSGDKTIISQYSLHPIEDLGLLKMDFLGLKNLTILENIREIVKKIRGEKIDLDNIPLDDSKTFSLLQKGETTGVFQLESGGMKRYLKQLKPTTFEDIIAMVSLYRPGPMEWIPDFIAGKHKKRTVRYIHPMLKPILEKTYGVAVYQEQILQIARDLAGFSLGEADILRKAMGKKIAKLLYEQKKKFIEGCVKNKISEKTAQAIFEFIEPFAGYGFNRSHGACYAMIAYQTAYLKAHFPTEFMASLLTADQGDTDRIAILVEECRSMGIKVLPPDINESYSTFTVVAESLSESSPRIRFGLMAIKNIGTNIVQVIIHERKNQSSYKSLDDFLSRVKTKDLNKKSLESLIKCGALDNFGERNQMIYNIDRLLLYIKESHKEAESRQASLFGMMALPQSIISLPLERVDAASKGQRLIWEKEHLGLYVSEHPFTQFKMFLEDKIVPCSKLTSDLVNRSIRTAGVVNTIKRVITRSGEPMLFVRIEDISGGLEILVFPSVLKANSNIWREEAVLLIEGKVSDKDGELKVLCNTVQELNLEKIDEIADSLENIHMEDSLNQGRENKGGQKKNILRNFVSHIIQVIVPAVLTSEISLKLKNIFQSHQGNHPVYLVVPNGQKLSKIATDFSIDYSEEIKSKIEAIVGLNSVRIEGNTLKH